MSSKRSSSNSSAGGPSAKKASGSSSGSGSGNRSVKAVFAESTFDKKTCIYTYCGGRINIDARIKKLIESVVNEEGVTEIAEKADGGPFVGLFSHCTALRSITFPQTDTFVRIGHSALRGCTSITALTVPDSCVDIEKYALFNCSSLTSLTSFTFPNKCTKLSLSVLENCTSLTTLNISDDCFEIDAWSVERCTSLNTLAIPNACTPIHPSVFPRCTALQALADNANLTIEEYCRNKWRAPRLFAFKVNLFVSYNVLNRLRLSNPLLNDPLIDKTSILSVMYDRITSDDVRRKFMEFLDYKWMGNK